MRKIRPAGHRLSQFILLLLIFLCAALFVWHVSSGEGKETIYQVSVITALMKGDYDGSMNLRTLREHGDFGIGTFDHLDGEMVELDSKFYQVKSDGRVYIAGDSVMTPFSMVTFFFPDKTILLNKPMDFEGLVKFIDMNIPTKNIPYAIKVDGNFNYVKTRSVPRQEKPYSELAAVVKDQAIFGLHDIKGTLVAFRVPEYAKGINAAGYHMHFLSADRKSGGHVLQCNIISGKIEIDHTDQFHVTLPDKRGFYGLDLSQEEKAAIDKVEKGT